jgi:hypothetical protein
MYGARRVPLRLSFRAFSQTALLGARQFAEDFRSNLYGAESQAALEAAKISLFDASDLVDTDYQFSGRLVSQVDMTLNLGVWGFQRNASFDAGYIKRVTLTGEGYVLDEEGNLVRDENGDAVVHNETLEIDITADEEPVNYG